MYTHSIQRAKQGGGHRDPYHAAVLLPDVYVPCCAHMLQQPSL